MIFFSLYEKLSLILIEKKMYTWRNGIKYNRIKSSQGVGIFYEILTVDVNRPKEYTIKCACLYLKECEREKQKTEIDCQIY
jgi:hypothetical protein